jgi:predicted nucleotidyltransferase
MKIPELELLGSVQGVLSDFVTQTQAAFGADLRAVVLFGSAVEARLRATSDVNLVVVLRRFERAQAEQLQRPLRVAQAAARLTPMFLLESEVPMAAEAFAVKFDDILHRRALLFGTDPFEQLHIPRAARIARLKQVLLNLKLRLREQFVLRGLREEQLVLAIADAAAPLRSCAATLLELEGHGAASPKDALLRFVESLPEASWSALLARVSEARETRNLESGVGAATLFELIELATRLLQRSESLALAPVGA